MGQPYPTSTRSFLSIFYFGLNTYITSCLWVIILLLLPTQTFATNNPDPTPYNTPLSLDPEARHLADSDW